MSALPTDHTQLYESCAFDIHGWSSLRERKKTLSSNGHNGYLYEVSSPEGIHLGYYNLRSSQAGKVVIANQQPFLQLSYTISGNKSYHIDSGHTMLASFEKQQYNYLFFPQQEIHLNWHANEPLETFELGVSPELMINFLPEEHPLYAIFHQSMEHNTPASLSKEHLPMQAGISTILYDMLNCPLDGRYKQLYIKAKTMELLAIQLKQYEQMLGIRQDANVRTLKKEDIDRMYLARDIIISNINSPCTLIDLAHQVGTNDAYLKSHFKLVFGTTVYGYLQGIKMTHARELLAQGKNVSEVAYLSGYKHTAHFTRAFKKHFGFAPGIMKR